MTAEIGQLRSADVRPLARLHREAFPDFFLSSLGERFLVQFYRGFLGDPTAVTAVARSADGVVLGAAVGTTQPEGFFRRLLRRQWPGFLAASGLTVLRRPSTAPRLLHAARRPAEVAAGATGALLSSICVSPRMQGAGLGGDLIDEWMRRATCAGARAASLTTDAESNAAVNHFYARHGWSLSEHFQTREGRHMNRYTIELGDH